MRDKNLDAVDTGTFEGPVIGDATLLFPPGGASLSRILRLGTRARPLRRSRTPRSFRASFDIPTLAFAGRLADADSTFCLLDVGASSGSAVRARLFGGGLCTADADREPEAAWDSFWLTAERFL